MKQKFTIEDIKSLFLKGANKANTHMVIAYDRIEDEDYIEYVRGDAEVNNKIAELTDNFCSIIEVYDLTDSIDWQLSQPCAMNYRRN